MYTVISVSLTPLIVWLKFSLPLPPFFVRLADNFLSLYQLYVLVLVFSGGIQIPIKVE